MSVDTISRDASQLTMPTAGQVPFTQAARRLRLSRLQLLELILEGRLKASRRGDEWSVDGEGLARLEAELPSPAPVEEDRLPPGLARMFWFISSWDVTQVFVLRQTLGLQKRAVHQSLTKLVAAGLIERCNVGEYRLSDRGQVYAATHQRPVW